MVLVDYLGEIFLYEKRYPEAIDSFRKSIALIENALIVKWNSYKEIR